MPRYSSYLTKIDINDALCICLLKECVKSHFIIFRSGVEDAPSIPPARGGHQLVMDSSGKKKFAYFLHPTYPLLSNFYLIFQYLLKLIRLTSKNR